MYKMLYCLSGFWKQLYFVKNNEGLVFIQCDSSFCLQPQEKNIQIPYIIKTFQNIICCFGKIN